MKEKKFQECKIRIKSSTSSPKFSSNQVPPHELQPQDYEKFFNWFFYFKIFEKSTKYLKFSHFKKSHFILGGESRDLGLG